MQFLSRRESSNLCWCSGESACLHGSGEATLKSHKHKQGNEENQLESRKWDVCKIAQEGNLDY